MASVPARANFFGSVSRWRGSPVKVSGFFGPLSTDTYLSLQALLLEFRAASMPKGLVAG